MIDSNEDILKKALRRMINSKVHDTHEAISLMVENGESLEKMKKLLEESLKTINEIERRLKILGEEL